MAQAPSTSKAGLVPRPPTVPPPTTALSPWRAPRAGDDRGIDEAPRWQRADSGLAAIVLLAVGREDRAGFQTIAQVRRSAEMS